MHHAYQTALVTGASSGIGKRLATLTRVVPRGVLRSAAKAMRRA